jgi:hypothetical protein
MCREIATAQSLHCPNNNSASEVYAWRAHSSGCRQQAERTPHQRLIGSSVVVYSRLARIASRRQAQEKSRRIPPPPRPEKRFAHERQGSRVRLVTQNFQCRDLFRIVRHQDRIAGSIPRQNRHVPLLHRGTEGNGSSAETNHSPRNEKQRNNRNEKAFSCMNRVPPPQQITQEGAKREVRIPLNAVL